MIPASGELKYTTSKSLKRIPANFPPEYLLSSPFLLSLPPLMCKPHVICSRSSEVIPDRHSCWLPFSSVACAEPVLQLLCRVRPYSIAGKPLYLDKDQIPYGGLLSLCINGLWTSSASFCMCFSPAVLPPHQPSFRSWLCRRLCPLLDHILPSSYSPLAWQSHAQPGH